MLSLFKAVKIVKTGFGGYPGGYSVGVAFFPLISYILRSKSVDFRSNPNILFPIE